MELLTDKAKEDFLNWLEIQDLAPYRVMFDTIPVFIQCAFIVKWLDEINYVLEMQYERYTNQYFGYVLDLDNGKRLDVSGNFHSRHEYTISGIQKANEIYNS